MLSRTQLVRPSFHRALTTSATLAPSSSQGTSSTSTTKRPSASKRTTQPIEEVEEDQWTPIYNALHGLVPPSPYQQRVTAEKRRRGNFFTSDKPPNFKLTTGFGSGRRALTTSASASKPAYVTCFNHSFEFLTAL